MAHSRWIPNFSLLLPENPLVYNGPTVAVWLTYAYLLAVTIRSLVHLLKSDGGAHSIATIDIQVTGGQNIVGLFGQWGAIQLLLASLLWILLFKYPGLIPLTLLVFLVEPFLRGLAGRLKPIRTVGTAPGSALNWYAVPIMSAALCYSLCQQ